MPWLRHLGSDVLRLEEEVRQHGRSELRKLRRLEDENVRLKRLVADLTLDKHPGAIRGWALSTHRGLSRAGRRDIRST